MRNIFFPHYLSGEPKKELKERTLLTILQLKEL